MVVPPDNAFRDQGMQMPNKDSIKLGLTPVTLAGQANLTEAHEGGPQLSRPFGPTHHNQTPLHHQLDNMHQHCRLPSLQPHSSTKVIRAPLLRRSDGAIEVNSVAAFEHVSMIMEGILRFAHAGSQGLQEKFQSGGSAPYRLKAPNQSAALQAAALVDTVRVLPYSIDLMQMAWTLDLSKRMYTPQRHEQRNAFNAAGAREAPR